jgi:integrase
LLERLFVHLRKRKESSHWQLELRFPPGFEFDMATHAMFEGKRHFVKSMRTADKAEAEYRAAAFIHNFKIALYRWKQNRRRAADPTLPNPLLFEKTRQFRDGLQIIDGLHAVVIGPVVTFYGADGQPLSSAENALAWSAVAPEVEDEATAKAILHFDPKAELPPRFKPRASKSGDDEIIEAYIADRRLRPALVREARETWALYKKEIGKPLARATRKDGRELARLLAVEGRARATVAKKIGWLASAVRHAIAEETFSGSSPFIQVVSKTLGVSAVKRAPLSEEHMRQCWERLGTLSESDQLLWKLLAKTGMRLGEACSIAAEHAERGTGIRYVAVGTKTDASRRDIPVPDGIGMPTQIEGFLFGGGKSAAGKRLNRFIKKTIPDWTQHLVVHSLRHRAIDVFRLSGTGDPYLRRRLVGHAAQDVHDSYGASGPPMKLLVPMIEANPIDGSLQHA